MRRSPEKTGVTTKILFLLYGKSSNFFFHHSTSEQIQARQFEIAMTKKNVQYIDGSVYTHIEDEKIDF